MRRRFPQWVAVSVAVGGTLAVVGAVLARDPTLPAWERPGLRLAVGAGVALLVVAVALAILAPQLRALLRDPKAGPPSRHARARRHPAVTLFLASFVALFLEMVVIRYAGSQIRVFSFYKNVPLVSAFLGLGLGCALGEARRREVLWFLLWLLPLAVALAQAPFLFGGPLGRLAAMASSEHVLGDVAVADAPEGLRALGWQLGMAAFCVLTLFALAGTFLPLGRLLGDAFERLPRLRAYTVNIVGSVAGTAAFVLLGWWWAPPWVWLVVGLVPLLWWVDERRERMAALALVALVAAAVAPRTGETIWSPYQKLVGHPLSLKGARGELPGYLVEISDVFYQVAVDLRPESVERAGGNPFPHYDEAFRALAQPAHRILVVGAGTGNDVAAALRAGATEVDAVDIDPAIVAFGRDHHPEHPYDDGRVHVIVDDARAAFRRLPAHHYDVVAFGLLDSHTQLGISSVRLDNYVFTRESLAEARRLLVPGGSLVLTAATFRDWFRARFLRLVQSVCDVPVQMRRQASWMTYVCTVDTPDDPPPVRADAATLPSDDWPFLYLPARGVPAAYVVVLALLVAGSVVLLRLSGLSPARFTAYHGHLFFLGAAFLLMEVYAINRLALLFGTTWIVSAVAIMTVLTLIVAANLTVALAGDVPYVLAYGGIALSLLVSFALDPHAVLGRGLAASGGYAFVVLLPVYFAGLVFARSFTRAPEAGAAMGANMLGSVVGGWSEYASMAVGLRALALLALAFYLGSLVCLVRDRRRAQAADAACAVPSAAGPPPRPQNIS